MKDGRDRHFISVENILTFKDESHIHVLHGNLIDFNTSIFQF